MTYTTENKTEQTETTEISFDFDSMDLESNSMKVWERKEVAKNNRIVLKRKPGRSEKKLLLSMVARFLRSIFPSV